ncbi:hypothetical protein E2562_035029 [Oryza meyeriana var. granulata]|uniref:Uncharacterized protein n=1 Tax=Oryza meyeriana var. granulata TaxID=110450 RepID=A0A6G1FF94_9ORYZ|nr:hypothetical protein E2562_035029 [Oryza meyeriana var. granulata]
MAVVRSEGAAMTAMRSEAAAMATVRLGVRGGGHGADSCRLSLHSHHLHRSRYSSSQRRCTSSELRLSKPPFSTSLTRPISHRRLGVVMAREARRSL